MNGSQVGPISADVRAFVSTFREAMCVLRVPAPPRFEVDPATWVAVSPTQSTGPADSAALLEATADVVVDVAV
jgi:hypothetical protein